MLITCSRDDQSIRLWNYLTGECEFASEFYVRENGLIRSQAKPLITVAIHPSGYQLAIACIDKIVVNSIFHDILRAINSLQIANAHILKYSRGGHLLFVVDKNGIRAYNSYTLKPASDIIRRDGLKLTELVFADLDRAFAIVHTNGKVERFLLPCFSLIEVVNPEEEDPKETKEKFIYRSIDFVQEGPKDQVQAGNVTANTE